MLFLHSILYRIDGWRLRQSKTRLLDVVAVDGDASFGGVKHPEEQAQQRGLPAAAGAHYGTAGPSWHFPVEPLQISGLICSMQDLWHGLHASTLLHCAVYTTYKILRTLSSARLRHRNDRNLLKAQRV